MPGHIFTHQNGAYNMTVSDDGQGLLVFAIYHGFSPHAIMVPADAVDRLITALSADQARPIKHLVTCDCDAADKCPQGKVGSAVRCSIVKLT